MYCFICPSSFPIVLLASQIARRTAAQTIANRRDVSQRIISRCFQEHSLEENRKSQPISARTFSFLSIAPGMPFSLALLGQKRYRSGPEHPHTAKAGCRLAFGGRERNLSAGSVGGVDFLQHRYNR